MRKIANINIRYFLFQKFNFPPALLRIRLKHARISLEEKYIYNKNNKFYINTEKINIYIRNFYFQKLLFI